MTAFVVHEGRYKLAGDPPCPSCGNCDATDCTPGEYPKCWGCGAIMLFRGRTPKAPCVSPSGRIDGHMKYVKGHSKGRMRCAFCGRSS